MAAKVIEFPDKVRHWKERQARQQQEIDNAVDAYQNALAAGDKDSAQELLARLHHMLEAVRLFGYGDDRITARRAAEDCEPDARPARHER